jgi:hypothetical protein
MAEEVEIIESQGYEIVEAHQRAEYDMQIATAKKYPRSLKRVKDTCIDLINFDDTGEIAASCSYAIPRANKVITGPSTHLAQIIAQQFGNIRVDAKTKHIDYKNQQTVSEAVCFDLETNYACKIEVRKSIRDKNGHTYSNDMIAVTSNAANSIAFRNAVFKVVPRALTDAILKAAQDKVTSHIKNEEDMVKLRKTIIDSFQNSYKVDEKMLLRHLGMQNAEDIKKDNVPILKAMFQALKDGDSTVEEMFNLTPRASANSAEQDKVTKTFVRKTADQATKPAAPPVAPPADTKSEKKPDPVKKEDKKKDPPASSAAPKLF